MDTQPISNCCPKCQAPLPPDAPQGLCPKCLLAAVATPTDAGQPAGRPTPPPLEQVAAAFPQLEILEFIGQGGMGFVFKARQPKLDRLVALKILPQSLAADPTFAERFNREAKLLARLNHPGIVTVHDFGVASSGTSQTPDARSQTQFYYLLMEFVDGVNLRQAMQAGRFTPDQALAIVPKICEALQFAHNEGILHRDIKPENILLDAKGRVKIADFGIAKLVGTDAPLTPSLSPSDGERVAERLGEGLPHVALTEAGKALGTPNYMAPEQRDCSGEVDHRADIYSLGVVFYEMLTGELPLGRFAPPSQKSAADPRVDEVVLRALEKEKARRYSSADEVKTQVETITATPDSGRRRGDESQTEKQSANRDKSQSLLTSSPTGVEPRFSRTPIVGTVLLLIPLLTWSYGFLVKVVSPGMKHWELSVLTFWKDVLILLSVTVVVTTTILGWVSVAQIRRSAGRLHGLWLAVFDGLLFPLLALDAGLVLIWSNVLASKHWLLVLSVASVVLVDFLIIRAVWRAVNRPLDSTSGSNRGDEAPSEKPESQNLATLAATKAGRQGSRGWLFAVIALHGIGFIALALFCAFIVPHFKELLAGFGAKLPPATQLVIFVSDLVRSSHYLLLAVLLGLDGVICWLLHRFTGRKVFATWAVTVLAGFVLLIALALFGLYLPVMSLAETVKRPTSATSTQQSASNHSFGPVIERVVTNAIDFDTGRTGKSTQSGIDAVADVSQTNSGLWGIQMRAVVNITSSDWDSWTAQQASELAAGFVSKLRPPEARTMLGAYPSPTSFLFQTREGSVGLLQITGLTENPRGVKVRYKLVQLGKATPPAEPAVPEKTFGPVMERVLPNLRDRDAHFINFDSGQIVMPPNGLNWNKDLSGFLNWAVEAGADMGVIEAGDEGLRLVGYSRDACFSEVSPSSWERINAIGLLHTWQMAARTNQVLLGNPKSFPRTLMFQTHSGKRGLLQITGFTENPRGVKIRYKLVQSLSSSSATKPLSAQLGRFIPQAPFVAQLPVGELELVGISEFEKCTDPSLGVTHEQKSGLEKTWWQPDGSPLNQQIPCISGSLKQNGRDIYEIALRIRGQTNGTPGVEIESVTNSGAYPAGIAGATWARRVEDMTFQKTLSCEPSLSQASFRIGVATEAWRTERSMELSSGAFAGGEAGNVMLSVVDAGEETTVTCQYEQRPGWQTRLIAQGAKGEIEPVRRGPFQGVGNISSETLIFHPADINDARLHLQRRPYWWVEFLNVSLKPGQPTQVEVCDKLVQVEK